MGNPPIIELNGKLYDADTGRLLGSKDSTGKKISPKKGPIRNVDGVIHSGNSVKFHKKLADAKQNVSDTAKEMSRKVAPSAQRVSEHSKTLMRKAVKKPTIALNSSSVKSKLQINQHKPLDRMISNGTAAVRPVIDSALARAQTIQRSQLVTRFNEIKTAKPEPDRKVIQELKTLPAVDDVHAKNLAKLKEQEKEGVDSVDDDLTSVAIEMANTYKPLDENKKARAYVRAAEKLHMRPKAFVTYVAILFAALIIGTAIFEYSNNLVFYLDDRSAGISSHLPSYVASGFRLSEVTRSGGNVSVSYVSNSDSRNYRITESASNWDSQSLLQGVVNPAVGSTYTSLEANGRIVYIFNKEAVWVSGGIYYILTNNAYLPQNELTQIIDGS